MENKIPLIVGGVVVTGLLVYYFYNKSSSSDDTQTAPSGISGTAGGLGGDGLSGDSPLDGGTTNNYYTTGTNGGENIPSANSGISDIIGDTYVQTPRGNNYTMLTDENSRRFDYKLPSNIQNYSIRGLPDVVKGVGDSAHVLDKESAIIVPEDATGRTSKSPNLPKNGNAVQTFVPYKQTLTSYNSAGAQSQSASKPTFVSLTTAKQTTPKVTLTQTKSMGTVKFIKN